MQAVAGDELRKHVHVHVGVLPAPRRAAEEADARLVRHAPAAPHLQRAVPSQVEIRRDALQEREHEHDVGLQVDARQVSGHAFSACKCVGVRARAHCGGAYGGLGPWRERECELEQLARHSRSDAAAHVSKASDAACVTLLTCAAAFHGKARRAARMAARRGQHAANGSRSPGSSAAAGAARRVMAYSAAKRVHEHRQRVRKSASFG